MKESNKITSGIGIKLKKSATLYHTIQGFIKMIQGKSEPNDALRLRFGNVYETIEFSGMENIIQSNHLIKDGIQASKI